MIKAIDKKSTELHMEETEWGKYYRGTEAALVASGLIKPEWFPGKPGNPKTSCYIVMLDGEMKVVHYTSMGTRLLEDITKIKLYKVGKRFAAHIHFSKEEQEQKYLRNEIERLHADKQKALNDAPKNIGQFRVSKSESIEWFLRGALDMFQCSMLLLSVRHE
jgi:hypothetical protein